jgi:polar amino acid transport system ATP-binding protein
VTALVIEGLRKSFGRLEVLRGVDLEVEQHEVVCLIGASGSGKSTLLRCINLIEPVDAGRIVVEGDEITRRGTNVTDPAVTEPVEAAGRDRAGAGDEA